MTQELLNDQKRHLAIQCLIDGWGYPQSDKIKKNLGFIGESFKVLSDELLNNHQKELNNIEKQMILNCLDGALDYVNIDIPSLYDISEDELRKFKEDLEKHWGMKSSYK